MKWKYSSKLKVPKVLSEQSTVGSLMQLFKAPIFFYYILPNYMIFKNLIVAQLLHGYQNEFFNKGTCCAITALTTAFTVYGQKIKN